MPQEDELEGMALTTGKIYIGYIVLENWRARKYGIRQASDIGEYVETVPPCRSQPSSATCPYVKARMSRILRSRRRKRRRRKVQLFLDVVQS